MTSVHRDFEKSEPQLRHDFYVHLAVYLAVNAALAAIDILRSPEQLWFFWVVGGWGIGVVAHALSVFLGHRNDQPRGPSVPNRPEASDNNMTAV